MTKLSGVDAERPTTPAERPSTPTTQPIGLNSSGELSKVQKEADDTDSVAKTFLLDPPMDSPRDPPKVTEQPSCCSSSAGTVSKEALDLISCQQSVAGISSRNCVML